jgi:hypothetical protein
LISVIDAIVDMSSLTRVQLETLKLYVAVTQNQITLQEALRSRKILGISKGTHYRIISQARRNFERSLFTVAVGVQMGLLKPTDLQKFFTSVSTVPDQVDPERLPEVMSLVETLVSRLVM